MAIRQESKPGELPSQYEARLFDQTRLISAFTAYILLAYSKYLF